MKYANTVPCHKGWNDKEHNWNGQCCCNCKHQLPINAHPWNNGFGKGSVMDIIGYGCHAPDLFPHVTFMELDDNGEHHSMCECWEERDWKLSAGGNAIPVDKKEVTNAM